MLKETEALLNQFALNVVSEAKANAPSTSGALASSLDYEIVIEGDVIRVLFNGVDYAKFMDKGVQGKDPSKIKDGFQKAPNSPFKFGSGTGRKGGLRGAIDKWVIRKGLSGVRDDKGRFVPRKTMVFLISRSIYFTGLRPTMFFTKAFEKHNKNIISKLDKALAKDYANQLRVEIEKI